jgi:hypothetical protein
MGYGKTDLALLAFLLNLMSHKPRVNAPEWVNVLVVLFITVLVLILVVMSLLFNGRKTSRLR